MIIDGKAIASRKLEELKKKIMALSRPPKLAIVTKGDDPATAIYIRKKTAAAVQVGIKIQIVSEISQVESDADGIIVQLPYPNEDEAINQIPPEKDIDGLTAKSKFLTATVKAVLIALEEAGVDPKGKIIAVVGQGRLIGKPLADSLEKMGATVIRCDSKTPDLASRTRTADILVAATGVARLITKDMVKPNSVVIDCGSPYAEVNPDVVEVASAVTPVPGGIGPLTVFSLLDNCFHACQDVSL